VERRGRVEHLRQQPMEHDGRYSGRRVEAAATPTPPRFHPGRDCRRIDLTSSLQAWSDSPSSNFGWVFLVAAADTFCVRFLRSYDGREPAQADRAVLPAGTQSITFQDGLNGYASAQDAHIQQFYPTTNFGSAAVVKWDTDEPSSSANYSYGRSVSMMSSETARARFDRIHHPRRDIDAPYHERHGGQRDHERGRGGLVRGCRHL